jgi:DNA repair protein RadC
MKLKDLPKIDLPREKLVKYGPEKLSNAELLALLLRTGAKGLNVLELSKVLFRKFGNEGLPNASIEDLKKTFGLGEAKACEIVACFELGKRLLQNKQAELIMTPEDVWKECRDIVSGKKEYFVIFYLDVRSQEIKRDIIFMGTVNKVMIHPREIFEPAIRCLSAHIILAHNHAHDSVEPTASDREVTKRLVEAGHILGIEVRDHIIVNKTHCFSMKNSGAWPKIQRTVSEVLQN